MFLTIASDMYLTSANLPNVMREVSIIGICAVGLTFVLLTGGIDLSVGSVKGAVLLAAVALDRFIHRQGKSVCRGDGASRGSAGGREGQLCNTVFTAGLVCNSLAAAKPACCSGAHLWR